MHSFLHQSKNVMGEINLIADNLITDGTLHRCSTTSKPNEQDGAYIIHIDEPYSMWCKNWRTGEENTYTAKEEGSMNTEERRIFTARIQAEREQREADKAKRYGEASTKAQNIWNGAQTANDTHPYLQKKGVSNFGLRQTHDKKLIVSIMDTANKIQSLQFIQEDGTKRFLSGGKTQGGFFHIPAKDKNTNSTLCIVEGYATGASVHMATGYAVLVAFNAGNLQHIALTARNKYPQREIILCADNDHNTDNEENIGIEKATEAVMASQAKLAVCPLVNGGKADFNDLHQVQGLDAVKTVIEGATFPKIQEQSKERNSLRVVTVEELLSMELPQREYILDPVIPSQGLAMLFADRGIGKTFTALHMAYAIATGGNIFTWKAPQPYPVLYIDGEMPATTMQSRLASIVESSTLEPPENFFQIVTPDLQGEACMPNLASNEGQQFIEPYLKNVKFVVVDNLATLCRHGRSNDEESWTPVQEWILNLRRRDISVLLVHHASKNGSQRGTSAKEDILDTVIQLRRPKDYETSQGARFEVHLTKARGIVGEEAEPFEAQLFEEDNTFKWQVKSVEANRIEQIKSLALENYTQRDIGEELGISASVVNRLCLKHNIKTTGAKK